jgi:hypothetical protein
MGQSGARTIKIKCTYLAGGALPSEAQALTDLVVAGRIPADASYRSSRGVPRPERVVESRYSRGRDA